jgi:hypothetical protein
MGLLPPRELFQNGPSDVRKKGLDFDTATLAEKSLEAGPGESVLRRGVSRCEAFTVASRVRGVYER